MDTPEKTSLVTMKCESLPIFLPSQKPKMYNYPKVSTAFYSSLYYRKPNKLTVPLIADFNANGSIRRCNGKNPTAAENISLKQPINMKKKLIQNTNTLKLEQLIPESVMNVVGRIGSSVVNSRQNGRNSEFSTKDMYYAVKADDLERVAEILGM